MGKAWMVALLLAAGCGGSRVVVQPPPPGACVCKGDACACVHCKTPPPADGTRPPCPCRESALPR